MRSKIINFFALDMDMLCVRLEIVEDRRESNLQKYNQSILPFILKGRITFVTSSWSLLVSSCPSSTAFLAKRLLSGVAKDCFALQAALSGQEWRMQMRPAHFTMRIGIALGQEKACSLLDFNKKRKNQKRAKLGALPQLRMNLC